MRFLILQVLVAFHAVSPLRPGELDNLCKVLKVTEAPPASESGQIGFEITETTAVGPKAIAYRYRYAIDGEKIVVVTQGVDEEGRPQDFVVCRNNRHEFKLERFPNGWGIRHFGARYGPVSWELNVYYAMELHVNLYAVQLRNHKVSDLLANPDYRVVALRVGRRDYQVQATWPDGIREGIREFKCSIRVSSSGNYAYIRAASSVRLSEDDRSDVEDVINEVAEDPDRPRLVRSTIDRVATVRGEKYRYETRKTYQVRAGVPDEEKGAFEITHYGLLEPASIPTGEAAEHPPDALINWTPLYLALAVVVGLAAIFFGRRLVTDGRVAKPAPRSGGQT